LNKEYRKAKMKITKNLLYWSRYVGGPTMAVIAQKCPHIQVTVVDLNVERIAAWNDEDLDNIPIYEPGLDKIVGEARGRNLFFSTDVEKQLTRLRLFLSRLTHPQTYGKGDGSRSKIH
jgi:UDPglucose 6-dehydrogenase